MGTSSVVTDCSIKPINSTPECQVVSQRMRQQFYTLTALIFPQLCLAYIVSSKYCSQCTRICIFEEQYSLKLVIFSIKQHPTVTVAKEKTRLGIGHLKNLKFKSYTSKTILLAIDKNKLLTFLNITSYR